MFGSYPKPVKYKNTNVAYMCNALGRTLVAFMLNLDSRNSLETEGESEALSLMVELYANVLSECGVGIAMIQFTAIGGYGVSVAESIKEGDFEQARLSSDWWRAVETGRIDSMGW